jgi:2-oxoisovalerate dehydrogenase E1 component alpha subunit
MKDRNHLTNIGLSHSVNIIENGIIDIPMLQLLQADGTTHENVELPQLDKETALKIYRTMQYIRVLDERMIAAQRQGRISFYLACTGKI